MTGPPRFIEFVDRKTPETAALIEFLSPAIQRNQHTNFGPVADRLESTLMQLNGADTTRAAVMVANATLGLQAAVCAFDNLCGRRLRWVTSDFGFFTSFIGPFHDQRLVACSANGMLTPDALVDGDYDAILATNIFGLHERFEAIFDFARRHDKVLLIDNAAGFGALAPWHSDPPSGLLWAEVVSFHHTKPWGMGEGGAVFAPADLCPVLRAAVNFGVGGGQRLEDIRWCTNGKLSELAAAQILTRVETRDHWIPGFRDQAQRMMDLGQQAGLHPLVPVPPTRAVPGQIAFQHDRPIALEALENRHFRILKYYRPAPGSGAQARSLYDRAVNLPCHGDMAALDDATILDTLDTVLRAAP